MTDYQALIRALAGSNVECIVVGGVAATVHGSARLTQDLDIVYRRTPDNIDRLSSSLEPYHPYLRGAPPGLPFRWDSETIEKGLNFTLSTSIGELDLFAEITAGGNYEQLRPHCIQVRLFGFDVYCLGLAKLIDVKKASGRPKDLEAIAELETILEESEC